MGERNQFTVLIIDDAPDTLELIRLILEDQGIICLSAASGDQGLDIADKANVDLILLDILMPNLDGFETCRRLKADPRTGDIPIIFITGKGDDASISRGFELGAIDYIQKPFSRYEMLRRVQNHLDSIRQKRLLHQLVGVKDRVLGIISHEIRNQFSSLLSVYDLFMDELAAHADQELQAHLLQLSAGLSETQELFDNLITWSKNQRGKFRIQIRRLHLYSLIQEVENSLSTALQRKNIRLDNRIEPDLFIESDETLVSLILRNYISNAIKFSYRGGEIIARAERDGSNMRLIIQDFGTGVDASVRDRLFKITENPTMPGTEKEKGTGIGLSICRDFAESLGGRTGFYSEEGRGTSFYLDLSLS